MLSPISSRAPLPVPHAPPAAGPPLPPDGRARGARSGEARGASGPGAVPAPRAPGDPLSFAGLDAAIEEARRVATRRGDGPRDPASYAELCSRLKRASARLPSAERRAVAEPLLRTLDRLGASGYARLLAADPDRVGAAGLVLDVAQAVLQRGEGYESRATAAFQEVVSDLYEGFLSAEDRRGVKPPDHGAVPPLVRWGSAAVGPYTWPATATAALDVEAAIVSLPWPNAKGGLLAWPALAHETAGHDVLAADDGLRDELARVVKREVVAERMAPELASYWADRIDEAAADVLGVLNMGPAAAVGLVGFVRAMRGAGGGTATLSGSGAADGSHPADVARAYLVAETVRLLSFRGAARWADRIAAEADRDAGKIRLGGLAVTAGVAKASAAVVARAVVKTRLSALEGHALGEIQDWRDRDEKVVAELRSEIRAGAEGPGRMRASLATGAYAAHAVAAAVYEALAGTTPPQVAMERMVDLLARMSSRRGDPKPAPRAQPAGGPGRGVAEGPMNERASSKIRSSESASSWPSSTETRREVGALATKASTSAMGTVSSFVPAMQSAGTLTSGKAG